jgi:hypothetical protein
MIPTRLPALFLICLAVAAAASQSQTKPAPDRGGVSYISYEQARPVLEPMAEALPPELKTATPQQLPAVWSKWVARRDAEIRSRLALGNEDSLLNFLLFGTSFTQRPRITLRELGQVGEKRLLSGGSPEAAAFNERIKARINDLIRAISAPGKDERLLYARQLLASKGYQPQTPAGKEGITQFMLAGLVRVLGENSSYARVLESARLLGDPSAEFAERSKLYATRGLSSDTSLMPNFAIEQTLLSMKAKGLLQASSVRRVGIVGPGLDFTDKQDGYDFYPIQCIQPFAVIDSLLRAGLANREQLRVDTFDLNPRVNDHLQRAAAAAKRGTSYTIQLPRDPNSGWKPEALSYWTRFGDQLGKPVPPVAPPAGVSDVKIRAVAVRPALVSIISPRDANIVLQRLDVAANEQFDLLIATNILVYYDVFEQCLALSNIERMLRPGGLLLSNNALLELPGSGMRSVGYETVVYSDKANDGDHIVLYQRVSGK